MITRMNHTGFVVRDLDKSISFYRDVIGLEVVASRQRRGAPISQVIGYDDAHLKICLLGSSSEHMLELIQYVHPPGTDRHSDDRKTLGGTHLAFDVDDIEATFRQLVNNGAAGLNPPIELQPGRIACYLQDPDGNWIELIQSGE